MSSSEGSATLAPRAGRVAKATHWDAAIEEVYGSQRWVLGS